jgi:hypothetical protein
MIIDAEELKSAYLWQMEEFRQARVNKRCKRDLHVRIKEMYTYIRETELKEEKEELKQCEKALKKREEELRTPEE